MWTEPFADVHKVKGLQGIYIVSQITSSMSADSVDIGPEHIVTIITFDWGIDWRLLNVTRSFTHCEKVIFYFCYNLCYTVFQIKELLIAKLILL